MAFGPQRIAAVVLLVLGFALFANIIPIPGSTTLSTCIESVVNITPQAVVCGSPTSNIQGIALGNVWLTGSDSNYIGSSTQITFAQGALMVSYQLGTGLTLSSDSLGYCTNPSLNVYGYYCASLTKLPVSAGAVYGGLPTLTSSSPPIALGTSIIFQVTITDSSGASYVYTAMAFYQLSSYTVSFNVVSSAGGGVSGATVQLTLNGAAYSTLTTGTAGTVSESLPPYEFTATASANGYATEPSQSFSAATTSTVTFTMTPETVSSISVLVQAASETTIPAVGATVTLFTAGGTQVGSAQTTGSNGKATFTGTFPAMNSYYIAASWTLTNATFGVPKTYTAQSLAFWPANGATELVILIVTPPTGCVGSSCTPPISLSCTPTGSNATILVTVISSNSAPISGATVSVGGAGGTVATTNARGQACLNNIAVPPPTVTFGSTQISVYQGHVDVSASAKGYNSATQSVNLKEAVESSAVFTLTSGSSLSIGFGQIAGAIFMIGGLVLLVKKEEE